MDISVKVVHTTAQCVCRNERKTHKSQNYSAFWCFLQKIVYFCDKLGFM